MVNGQRLMVNIFIFATRKSSTKKPLTVNH